MNDILYENASLERQYYAKYFDDIDALLSSEKMSGLIKGLDEDSKVELISALRRLKEVKSDIRQAYDFFSDVEKSRLAESRNCFAEGIIENKGFYKFKNYYLPIKDFRAEIFFDKLGIESTTVKKATDEDFIDVGGYIGDSALTMSEYTEGKIHIFEPIEMHTRLIKETAKLNGIGRFEINQVALSDHVGEESFFVNEREYVSGLKQVGGRVYQNISKVSVTTIDRYVEEKELNIGLIKIHAEGAEQEVIRGAKRTITEQTPIIIVEINHTESDFFDIKPMLEKMVPNYNFHIYKPANGNILLGLKLIAEIRG